MLVQFLSQLVARSPPTRGGGTSVSMVCSEIVEASPLLVKSLFKVCTLHVMPADVRIGELARRTGVSADLLRAWERRYGLLRPERSSGGYRLYSAEDEQRVRTMTDALARGISAGEAARVALVERADRRPTETLV